MKEKKVGAVIFEGGRPDTPIEQDMISVRKGIVLDSLTKLLSVPDIDQVLLATTYVDLARQARSMGASVTCKKYSPVFHFGRALRHLVDKHSIDAAICMGGATVPLARTSDFAWIARQLRSRTGVVVVNNAQSADLIGFAPARALHNIELPAHDNFLGYLLREAGLERVLIENSARINFDLDTPADLLILDTIKSTGPHVREALGRLRLDSSRLRAALEVLRRPYAETALVGRVGPTLMAVINANLPVRLRVFSEERGMKALGREVNGQAVSLLGEFIRLAGPEEFFSSLARVADVAFIDTRVLFAHFGCADVPGDRYYSDLGQPDRIQDPFISRFTRAALSCPIPVILGGHTLVYGGLWILLEEHSLLKHGLPQLPRS